jgi:hypothetical protein
MISDAANSLLLSTTKSRLYRQFFTREEIRRLDATPPDSAASDIYLLRTLLRRALAASSTIKLSLNQHLAMLAAFSQAAVSLASLVRIHFKQQPEPPDLPLLWAADDDDPLAAPFAHLA